MVDIKVTAVEGGAHVSFPRDAAANASFKSTFPKARWVPGVSAWAIPGVTAERRATKWASEMQAIAANAEKSIEGEKGDAAVEGREADPIKMLLSRAKEIKSNNAVVSEAGVRYRFAYNEQAVSIARGLPGAWFGGEPKAWSFVPRSLSDVDRIIEGCARIRAVNVAAQQAEAARKAEPQAEWDRQRAAERKAREIATRAASNASEWWIVGTEPSLGKPFQHRGRTMVATAYGERRRIDTDAILVNGGTTLDVENCIRVFVREATPADLAAAETARHVAEEAQRDQDAAAARAALEREAVIAHQADLLETCGAITITTVSGKPVVLTATYPGDDRGIVKARVMRDGVVAYDGDVDKAWRINTDAAAVRTQFSSILGAGATHTARLGDFGILALADAQAQVLNATIEAADVIAARRMTVAAAARAAEIRATAHVRQVLEIDDRDVRIGEAWMPREGHHEGYADWVRLRVPGDDKAVVSRRCPSLDAVRQRSPYWGGYPTSGSALYVLTDEDRDLLIAETREIERCREPMALIGHRVTSAVEDAEDLEMARREIAFEHQGEDAG